eukprot:gene7933-8788_t
MANAFDNDRVAVGVPMYKSVIQGFLNKPCSEIHMLDAGCGSGHYAKAFINSGIGKMSLLDSSEEIIARAKDNLAPHIQSKKIDVVKVGNLPQISFPDGCFDVVAFMQVLQHLDQPFTEFCNLKAAIAEAYRVLKPGGVLLINHSTHEQLRYGSWYANLLPHTVEKLCDKFISLKDLLSLLEKVGLGSACFVTCPWETLLPLNEYSRKDGPFDANWRKLDSLWTYAEQDGELESALHSLKEKKDFDMLDEWFENMEEKRKGCGRTISIFAQKPEN